MTDKQAHALLGDNSLVSFSSGLSDQGRNDILECLSFADTDASQKHSRRDAWTSWINRYQRGLFNNGFTLSGVLNSEILSITDRRDLPDVARKAIQASAHTELAELARSALDTLLRGAHAESFFQGWFKSGLSESFQVVPCRKDATGRVEVMVCGFNLRTETLQGGWLEDSLSGMTLRVNGGAYMYSPEAYEPYRERVLARLEKHSLRYFESLAQPSVKDDMTAEVH